MSYDLIVIPNFERDVKPLLKKYASLKKDLGALFKSLENNPIQGNPIGKDCYKIRLAITSKGKGKSGGARVIICVRVVAEKIYVLTIYDKSQKDNLSIKELEGLLRLI